MDNARQPACRPVLLQQWMQYAGHPLELTVTAPEGAPADTVHVHISFGGTRAAVIVTDPGGGGEGARVVQERQGEPCSHQQPAVAAEPSGSGGMDRLPSEMFYRIVSYLNVPEQLRVASVSRRWREAVDDCLSRRRQFDSVDFYPCSVSERSLQRLLPRMPALRQLSGFTLDVRIVARHCPLLEEIDLTQFTVDEESLRLLCQGCPRLRDVYMPMCCDKAAVTIALRHLPELRSLTLLGTDLSGRCFALLPASLEKLHMMECVGLQPSALSLLARCPALRELEISDVELENQGSLRAEDLETMLAACTRLERLTLWQLAPPLERCLPPVGLPALQYLDVRNSTATVTDATMRQIPHLLPNLRALNINDCQKVTESGLNYCVGRLRELRELYIWFMSCVTDRTLEQLHAAPLTEIKMGSFDVNRFTPDGLTRLVVSCRTLTSLILYGSSKDPLTALLEGLMRQLSPDRNVILTLNDDALSANDELPPVPPGGPLRVDWE